MGAERGRKMRQWVKTAETVGRIFYVFFFLLFFLFFSLGFTGSVRHWNYFSLNAFSAFLASALLRTVSASISCTECSMPDSVGVEEALTPLQSFLFLMAIC